MAVKHYLCFTFQWFSKWMEWFNRIHKTTHNLSAIKKLVNIIAPWTAKRRSSWRRMNVVKLAIPVPHYSQLAHSQGLAPLMLGYYT